MGIGGAASASADGTLDKSFGGTGKLGFDAVPGYSESVTDMTLDKQGRLLVVTSGTPPIGTLAGFVLRFLPNGKLDQSFSVGDDAFGNGVKAITAGDNLYLRSINVDKQGRIILGGGFSTVTNLNDLLLIRLLPTGAFDISLGGTGFRIYDLQGGSYDELKGITTDAQDRLVGFGTSQVPSTAPLGVIVRFLDDGTLDPAFDGDGWMIPIYSNDTTSIDDLKIDPKGRILATGYPGGQFGGFSVVRVKGDGAIDESFSLDGAESVYFGSSRRESSQSIVLDRKNRIILAGRILTKDGADIGVVRMLPNGKPDRSFSGDGKNRLSTGAYLASNDAALDRSGRLVLAGQVARNSFNESDGLIVRFRADGKLDRSFGKKGLVKEARAGQLIAFTSLLVDRANRYIAGGYTDLKTSTQIAISRYRTSRPRR